MAAPSGAQAGFSSGLFTNATAHTAFTNTAAALIAVTANEVVGTTSMGEVTSAPRAPIDYSSFNQDVQTRILGQRGINEFAFDVALDLTNPVHTGLRDDDGSTARSFVIEIKDTIGSADITYALFNGTVTSASIALEADSANTMTVTIAQTTAITFADAA